MQIHVGTSGYGYKEWKGIFYPEKISPQAMLHYYGERLSAVEINYTFYHMPTERVIAPWGEQVPDGFAFAFKAPQVITHLKQLRNVADETDYFFRTLAVLKGKLGPALFQFPRSFHAKKNLDSLKDFLTLLPGDTRCAFDLRSPTWSDAGIADILRERGCALCMEDTDENPVKEITPTADWGYLRLRRTDYTETDLAQWLAKILSRQWTRVFVFFKHEEEARGPQMAMRFRELASGATSAQADIT